MLGQSRNEEIHYAHLTWLGGDVLWGHSLDSLDTGNAERVLASVSGP